MEDTTEKDDSADSGMTASVENYLKAVYALEQEGLPGETNRLSALLGGIKPASVTAMVKKLAERDLLEYVPYQGVKLTPSGRRASLRVLRRHRLIETYLVEKLDYSWDEVHLEAEQLEHYFSDKLIEKLAKSLSDPEFDPHGDPIPARDGSVPIQESVSLGDCPPGRRMVVLRVLDQSAESLRFLATNALVPGAEVLILARDHSSGAILVQCNNKDLSLDRTLAFRILVASPSSHS